MTPVQQAAAEYIAHGWRLCRIWPGGKGTNDAHWNEPDYWLGGAHYPLESLGHGFGVGLLHEHSGTCALDIDHYPEAMKWLAERGVDLDSLVAADDAVQIRSGRADSAKLLYALPQRRRSVKCAKYGNNKFGLEMRSGATIVGHSVQDVLPPSLYLKRQTPYEWVFGPLGHWSTLPPLPDALAALWDELNAARASDSPRQANASQTPPELAEIERWLSQQDPDMHRDEWVKAGAKVHLASQGSPDGYDLFERWSSGALTQSRFPAPKKWAGPEDCYGRWKSYRLDHPQPATLDVDLARMLVEPEQFPVIVEPPAAPPKPDPEFAPPTDDGFGLTAEAAPGDKQNRELMEKRLVYLLRGKPRIFMLERHEHGLSPLKYEGGAGYLDDHGGFAYDEMGLAKIFTPFMAPITPLNKKRLEVPDPARYFQAASWGMAVNNFGFHPGEGRIYVEPTGVGRGKWNNLYDRSTIPAEMIPPLRFQQCLEFLFNRIREPLIRVWLWNFYAHAVQHRGVKIASAPLLFGKQGSGKSLLTAMIPKLLFGDQYVKELSYDELISRFATSTLATSWWVVLDELKNVGDQKVERSALANKLKPWITGDEIPVEHKNIAIYRIPNRVQVTANSNQSDALYIARGDAERRWAVSGMHEPLTKGSPNAEVETFVIPFLEDPHAPNYLTYIFNHHPIPNSFTPQATPPFTLSKERMSEMSEESWQTWIIDRAARGEKPFDKDMVHVHDVWQQMSIPHRPREGVIKGFLLDEFPEAAEQRTGTERGGVVWHNAKVWQQFPFRMMLEHYKTGMWPAAGVDFKRPGADPETIDDLIGASNA